jgi:vacuolar iron transporter family protein
VFAAHVEVELGIDPSDLTNPWHAALASAASFTIDSLLPLIAILAPPTAWRVPVTFVAVLAAIAVTGEVSARLGGTSRRAAVARVVIGGGLGMLVTYGIGQLVHTTGI